MGEQNWGQGSGPGQAQGPTQRQGRGSAFSRSAYGIPLDANWGISRSGTADVPPMLARQAPDPAREAERSADPARLDFWPRPGAGFQLLAALAALHAGAGLLGAAAGALAWYFARPMEVLPVLAAVTGAIVAAAGAVTFELARSGGPRAALAARVLLPAIDLVAAATLLWLLGDSVLAVLLFVVPALTASILLSWRSGAVFAAVSLACFAAMSMMRPGSLLHVWAAESLALAGVMIAMVLALGVYATVLLGVQSALLADAALLRGQRDTQDAEQQRLLESLTLLEDTQARLERERVQVNQQIAEVATTVLRLADGDPSAVRALQPGLFGPLEAVRAALGRLSLRLGTGSGPLPAAQEQQRTLETVLAATQEQGQMLAAADTALHSLGVSAHELVAEVQYLARGSGELPGIDRRQLFQLMRAMEQHAMAQASNTALLGARLAQMRTRQRELEAELRRLSRLSQMPDALPEWDRSGLYNQAALPQPRWGESQPGQPGGSTGSWR